MSTFEELKKAYYDGTSKRIQKEKLEFETTFRDHIDIIYSAVEAQYDGSSKFTINWVDLFDDYGMLGQIMSEWNKFKRGFQSYCTNKGWGNCVLSPDGTLHMEEKVVYHGGYYKD